MENNKNEITIEKEIYGWDVNDIADIIEKEFISILPEDIKNKLEGIEDFTPAEGFCMWLDEVYDNDKELPEFVKEYSKIHTEGDYMVQGSSLETDEDEFVLSVVTTFQPREDDNDNSDGRNHDNRLLYILLADGYGEPLFKVNYVK